MSIFKAYITPFDDQGNFSDEIEVTTDIDESSFGSLSRKLDNDKYNVGLFNTDQISFKLRNENGKYSNTNNTKSIFRFRRGGSKFRLTWQIQDYDTECGIATCGLEKISPEIDIFQGVINDEAAELNIDNQQIRFNALGFDSIFPSVETPFVSLSNGDLYSEALLTVLDQSEITKYLTVSGSNISTGLDIAIDTVAEFENTTVKEAIDILLFQSNSVMYIEDNTIYISNRDGGATSVKTFYGQASNNGIEDIIKINNVATGLNNVFNYWTWADTTLVSIDSSSVSANGVRKKEISFDEITNSSKRQQILDELRVDFGSLKEELVIRVPITYENLALQILDQIRVDYPTPYQSAVVGGEIPIYGLSKYGDAIFPFGEFSITIDDDTPYKIMGIKINTKNQVLDLKLKEQ